MNRQADRTPRRWLPLVAAALASAALLAGTIDLPIWRMTLRAPQYPQGLEIVAYGTRVEGDLREINIINHYVGMAEIDPVPAPEMRLYPLGVWTLVALCLLSPLHRLLGWLAAAAAALMPVAVLADLQWWLHRFGRDLDPSAPLRLDPFTPFALGSSGIGNFESTGMISWGLAAMLVAAALLAGAQLLAGRPRRRESERARLVTAEALVAAVLVAGAAAEPARAETPAAAASDPDAARLTASLTLQQRLDLAPRGAVVVVDGGVHAGPITITGPLTVAGRGRPVIDGGGDGTVVTIAGDGVRFSGFEVRGGGRITSQEPAGIKVAGSRHTIEDNVVRDVYFGIHVSKGEQNRVRRNQVAPGLGEGARPGHGISLWYVDESSVEDNLVEDSRDGIYLSFTDHLEVRGNEIRGTRYGIHSMYSRRATVVDNHVHDNLLGVALMNSQHLVMRGNILERHRAGATAYAVLLKDIDDLVLERNRILDNRVGLYADAVPIGRDGEALVRDNLIAGNGTALALQSNARLVFTGNRVADNLVDLRAEGAGTSERNEWSRAGRGNSWSGYRGYDADGDGIGDLPYRYETAMNELLRRNPAAQAFLLTPAHVTLENAARLFPLVRPRPLLVDPHPLVGGRR